MAGAMRIGGRPANALTLDEIQARENIQPVSSRVTEGGNDDLGAFNKLVAVLQSSGAIHEQKKNKPQVCPQSVIFVVMILCSLVFPLPSSDSLRISFQSRLDHLILLLLPLLSLSHQRALTPQTLATFWRRSWTLMMNICCLHLPLQHANTLAP